MNALDDEEKSEADKRKIIHGEDAIDDKGSNNGEMKEVCAWEGENAVNGAEENTAELDEGEKHGGWSSDV